MDPLHVEKYPGVNGEEFEIRILDWGNEIETAINLELLDNSDPRSINIRKDKHPKGTELKEIIEDAKKAITGITIIRRENIDEENEDEKNVDI